MNEDKFLFHIWITASPGIVDTKIVQELIKAGYDVSPAGQDAKFTISYNSNASITAIRVAKQLKEDKSSFIDDLVKTVQRILNLLKVDYHSIVYSEYTEYSRWHASNVPRSTNITAVPKDLN